MRPLSLLLILAALLPATALAQDEADPPAEEDPGDDGDDPPPSDEPDAPEPPATLDLSRAQKAPSITNDQLEWLKPKRNRMAQNPYAQTDFTAYTLEWGEVKLGLASWNVGALPRTQLGTVPALDILGLFNGNAKVNAVRAGKLDLAVTGGYSALPRETFKASYASAGLLASVIVTDPWSVHVGGSYGVLKATGQPDLSKLSPLLTGLTSNEVDAWTLQAAEERLDLDLKARVAQLHFATDYRFNRRDSVILQGSAYVWGDLTGGATVAGEEVGKESLPPILGFQEVVVDDGAPVANTFVVSGAWQFAWKAVDLRVGLGWSAQPFAWVIQPFDLSFRFGGPTRNEESRTWQGWRQNREDAGVGGPR